MVNSVFPLIVNEFASVLVYLHGLFSVMDFGLLNSGLYYCCLYLSFTLDGMLSVVAALQGFRFGGKVILYQFT